MAAVIDAGDGPLKVGDYIVWASRRGSSAWLTFGQVDGLEGGMVQASTALGVAVTKRPCQVLVTIHADKRAELQAAADRLARLEAAGVDNWEGYHYAFSDDDEEDY